VVETWMVCGGAEPQLVDRTIGVTATSGTGAPLSLSASERESLNVYYRNWVAVQQRGEDANLETDSPD
jgi:hypothetical protein